MLFSSCTVREICLFKCIWVEGGAKFMKHLKWTQTIKVCEPLVHSLHTENSNINVVKCCMCRSNQGGRGGQGMWHEWER
jgi:hypothetical protein